jgi:hypothetical protein
LLGLPFAAAAQSNDAQYCSALIAKYQAYLGGSASGKHGGLDQDATAKMAIDKCKAGDTSTGIPILEGKLKDAKIELPSRG